MTDSQPQTPAAPAADDSQAAASRDRWQAWLAFWRKNLSTPRQAWRTAFEFSEELRRDPAFWPHVMAMRGGLIMTAFGGAIAVSYAATLPFALAATVIVGTVAIAGVTTIGVVAGGRFALGHVRRAVHAVKNGDDVPPPAPVEKPLPQWMQKLGRTKVIKAIGQSRAWKQAGHLINSQKKWMLGGTALGGSALTAGLGIWMLAAQAVVLPVVVLGMAVSVATLWAVATIATGCIGLYFGTTSLLRWHRESKQAKAAAKAEATAAAAPVAGVAPAAALTTVTPGADFAAAQEQKRSDSTVATQNNPKKPSPPAVPGDKV